MRSVHGSDLPQEILHRIFGHVCVDQKLTVPAPGRGSPEWRYCEALRTLGHVCKSWGSAVKEFPAKLKCKAQSLEKICRAFPGLQELAVMGNGRTLEYWRSCDFSPLAACTRLSDFAIISSEAPPAVIDLGCLPHSATCFRYQATGTSPISCFKGTKHLPINHFQGDYKSQPLGLSTTLHSLSNLKSLDLNVEFGGGDGFEAVRSGSSLVMAFKRLKQLTCLRVSGNWAFTQMIQQGEYPEALCKLEFIDVMYTQAWLDDFTWHLVKLTSLTLCSHNSCITGNALEALSSEGINLVQNLPSVFEQPLIGLKEFSRCSPRYSDDALQQQEIQGIAALTALTRLGLSGYAKWDSLGALRKLPIKELYLYNCHEMEVELFVPGALQSLEHLVVSDIAWWESWKTLGGADPPPPRHHELEACKTAGKLLDGLPHIRCVEGKCALFALGMEIDLKQLKNLQDDLFDPTHYDVH